jgi:hypothetical protein
MIALQQALRRHRRRGAGERDQSIDADFLQHPARDFGPPAHARRQVGAGQQFAELQVALPRAAEQQQAIGAVGVALVGNEDIAAEHGLTPLPRAAE